MIAAAKMNKIIVLIMNHSESKISWPTHIEPLSKKNTNIINNDKKQ